MGVALLLGIVVISLGSLTASIGAVVESNAAAADAARVSADFDRALAPVEATGLHRGRVSFTDGELRVVQRDLTLLNSSGVVNRTAVDALVFRAGERRVAFLAGAIVRGTGDGSRMYARPPITASRGGDEGVLIVGAPRLNASHAAVTTGDDESVVLRSNVTHDRTALETDTYRVAVETRTPAAWRAYFRKRNATITGTRDLDGDGLESIVALFPGDRVAYLVVHDLHLEVAHAR